MNLMQKLNFPSPLWAPQDEGAPAATVDDAPVTDAPADDAPAAIDADLAAGTPPVDDAQASETDYSFLPDEFRQDGKNDIEGFRARFDEMTAQQAQRDEAQADVPEDGAGYDFTVPEDLDFGELELPEGFTFSMKTDDPTMAPVLEEFGGLLHKYNLPKAAASEFMGALAKYQAAEYSPLYAQSQAEMKSLGKGAGARIEAIGRVLETRLSADHVKAMQAATTTANGVKALEALLLPRGKQTAAAIPAEGKTLEAEMDNYYNTPTGKGT